ncbi:hypothetical protein PR202_ga25633 [Eleusine coracana subsp. coracana]|uniref:Peroxidase n=1 Tax=Eleusine coracana subsp. coracana TaxID=191504 RepID=A0AAV5DB84_ELECO|nr:hypothetical protein PR202_ga25633 [Eleusine coracana subsp. coracana]
MRWCRSDRLPPPCVWVPLPTRLPLTSLLPPPYELKAVDPTFPRTNPTSIRMDPAGSRLVINDAQLWVARLRWSKAAISVARISWLGGAKIRLGPLRPTFFVFGLSSRGQGHELFPNKTATFRAGVAGRYDDLPSQASMASNAAAVLTSCVLLLAATCQPAAAGYYKPANPDTCGLKVGYYYDKCPAAEKIVKHVVRAAVRQNPGIGAGLIRMLFHDCFRRARDASYFLSNGMVDFDIPAGRLDGRVSLESRTNFLPPPTFVLSQLIDSFRVKGLSTDDMVVLSGAHTVGRSHCSSFVPDRLAVPSNIDPVLAASLRGQCPANPDPNGNDPTVVQDVVTPAKLDNQYYKNVLAKKVLFTSDDALVTSPETATMVRDNAYVPGLWEKKYEAAMVKMASIEVKDWQRR